MMTAAWLRTGTAFALKVGGEAGDDIGRRVQALCESIADFAREQARCGHVEHLQLQCGQDRMSLVCIPKAGARAVLDRADELSRGLDALSGAHREVFRFLRQEA